MLTSMPACRLLLGAAIAAGELLFEHPLPVAPDELVWGIEPFHPTRLLQVLLLLAVGLCALRARAWLRRAWRIGWRDWALLGGLCVAAALMRIVSGPRVPGWINSHGYELLRDLLIRPPHDIDFHGHAQHALFETLFWILPRTEASVLAVHFALWLVGIPLVYVLGRSWLGDRSVGLWSAAAYAAMPTVAFFAGSEVHLVPGTTCLLAGLVAAQLAIADRNPLSLAAAALLLGYSTQFYPSLMLAPGVVILTFLGHPEGRLLLRSARAWLAFGLLLAIWIVPAIQLLDLSLHGRGIAGPDFFDTLTRAYLLVVPGLQVDATTESNVFLHLAFTPPLLPLAALAGLAIGWCRRWQRLRLASLTLAAVLLTLPGLQAGGLNPARLQLAGMPFWSLLAGVGLAYTAAGLATRLPESVRRYSGFALAAALAASSVLWPGPIPKQYSSHAEHDVFAAGLERVPAGCRVLWPAHPWGPIHPLPHYLVVPERLDLRFANLRSGRLPALRPERDCLVYYRPVSCYDRSSRSGSALNPADASGLIEACNLVERRLVLRPLYTVELPAVADYRQSYSRANLDIGFYRIEALGSEDIGD